MDSKSLIDKLKELVKKGNVSRIQVRRGDNVILNVPVNVGVAGGVLALASAKWVLLASVLATVGFGCTVEIVKDDGEIVSVVSEEDSQKVRDKAADVVGDVKDAINDRLNRDADAPDEVVDEIVFDEEQEP